MIKILITCRKIPIKINSLKIKLGASGRSLFLDKLNRVKMMKTGIRYIKNRKIKISLYPP